MLVPLSWLSDFAPFGVDPRDAAGVAGLGRQMDDLGLVVEAVRPVGTGLDGVVVARVEEVAAIEGADRVRRVVVDAGSAEPVEVVCGASNFAVGDLVPFTPVGTELPGGFRIERRRVKGVWSNGMLCSGRELALSEDGEGLLVLDAPAPPGAPLTEALGIEPDAVYDLAIETNRPDALCIAGVARDLAARLGLPFGVPTVADLLSRAATPSGASPAASSGASSGASPAASLTVEADDLCPLFVARVISGVRVGSSPRWMARRLTLAGMRPINAVVDASNYVMLEVGQPNHPYDLARLAGRGLSVRRARPGERLVTLDGVERTLGTDPRSGGAADDCLICDAEGAPVGIAGVMGGAGAEIGPGTTEVLLEAAWFVPMAVARTSRRLGLRTEASARFERGVDPGGVARAAARVCDLVAAAAGGELAPSALEARGDVPRRMPVRLRTARVNAILGTELGDAEVRGYLAPIGFEPVHAGPGITDTLVPSFRPDATREIDVIEEVARHHGYSRIPRARPSSPHVGGLSPYQRERRRLRELLAAAGADEAWTSSMVSPEAHRAIGLPPPDIEIENPLAREESVLRRSLLPGLLQAVAYNASHREDEVRLFEVGEVFEPPGASGQGAPSGDGPVPEREVAGLVLARHGDDARAAVQVWTGIASALRLAEVSLSASSPPGMHPTRSAAIIGARGRELGRVGEVGPEVMASYGLAGRRAGWVELDLAALLGEPRASEQARPVSRFPSADIDLAFEVQEAVPAAEVQRTLARAGGDLLTRIDLFDVYRGEPVATGARSLAFRLRFGSVDRTLTDQEVAKVRASCIAAVESSHAARLRA